ncbi:sulfotransferase family protein [Tindallia californiensis]|uniref:Sulfotransferase family protein n=1 Tax=Tindallia californiensis TaxID=159292 RepID=A0A1H3PE15_9FIRM|nr:sulfotransferase [Tindallia californiensis]SDY98639.1 Sulfotransferase family protein [Tindallia californiensis]
MQKRLFIVGAQRSGTTYLHRVLDEHPEIYMAKPIRPEPKFFLRKNAEEIDLKEYNKKFFRDAGHHKILGEKSTSYIECETSAKCIYDCFPDAIILILLRNPVQRAISNYRFSVENGMEKLSIEEAFHREDVRINDWSASVSPYAYKERGKYSKFIEPWTRLFGKNVILLIKEDFTSNIASIQMLYERLNVDASFVPNCYQARANESKIELGNIDGLIKQLESYFKPWNKRLEEKYNLDLASWRDSTNSYGLTDD